MAVPGETMHFHTSEMPKKSTFSVLFDIVAPWLLRDRHKTVISVQNSYFFLVRSILHPTTQNARPSPLGRAFNLKSPLKQKIFPFRGEIDLGFSVAVHRIGRSILKVFLVARPWCNCTGAQNITKNSQFQHFQISDFIAIRPVVSPWLSTELDGHF